MSNEVVKQFECMRSSTAANSETKLVFVENDYQYVIVRFPVFDGKTWSHPAFSGGFLIARNISEMAAFDLRLP